MVVDEWSDSSFKGVRLCDKGRVNFGKEEEIKSGWKVIICFEEECSKEFVEFYLIVLR